jgi:Mn2+/Fe2+ NRAMP family transporter
VCEGLGLEAGVDRSFGEAPEFYWLYTLLIVGSAGMILLPGAPLLRIILVSQILNGVLLPVILVFMLLLVNRETLMGRFTNGRVYNGVVWFTVALLIALTVLLVATSFWPGAAVVGT